MSTTKFTIQFEDGEKRTISAKYIKPEIIKGWWTYDEKGEEPYSYKTLDENQEEQEVEVPLGKTMYFHLEVKGIKPEEEIELQLYDYDELFWSSKDGDLGDNLDPDDSKFPNDPVFRTATVKQVGDKRIATIDVKLEEAWEPVIYDDHAGFKAKLDHTIELYWKITYNKLEDHFPKDEDNDRLRVGYNKRDLYIKPVVEGTSLPEFYDKYGKMIVFGLKRANDLVKATNPSAFTHFIATKIRISKEVTAIAQLNTIKTKVHLESINLDKNISKAIGYEVEEASSYVIKNSFKYVDVDEITTETRKKFSQYFTKKSLHSTLGVTLKGVRGVLRILDYVKVTKTIHSLLPQDGIYTEIPKPSSTVSVLSAFNNILKIKNLSSLGALFYVADVLATEVVKGMMEDMKEYSEEIIQKNKHKGLSVMETLVEQTAVDEFSGYFLQYGVSQEAHNKVMCGEIDTFTKLDDYVEEEGLDDGNTYTYLIKRVGKEETLKHIIDTVYVD